MFYRSMSLSYAQRRSLSSSLVWVTALTAVLTVAAPTLLPCPVAGASKGTILGDEDPESMMRTKDEDSEPKRGVAACLASSGKCPWPFTPAASVRVRVLPPSPRSSD
ncbi:hypothetical protein H9P43_006669 [Blastocladiella emersonii ATCC 22665]|nr:hypothetical protein H9P43_006669 [Blastocladiella emersonii ATCC 22665]